jgi:hypothetical protein
MEMGENELNPPFLLCQPVSDQLDLVGIKIVENDIVLLICKGYGELLHKIKELKLGMPLVATSEDVAIDDTKLCQQGKGWMLALVELHFFRVLGHKRFARVEALKHLNSGAPAHA